MVGTRTFAGRTTRVPTLAPAPPRPLPVLTPAPVPVDAPAKPLRSWRPKRVTFTPAALEFDYGRRIKDRAEALGLAVEVEKGNRLTGLRGGTPQQTYAAAKSTLAVVVAPPGQMKLQPIPPSADWQFHLAQGCPAHCQYCYLAGSLSGPPVVRAYANLPDLLDNLTNYVDRQPLAEKASYAESRAAEGGRTTFEVSCYTDVLGIEHLTGGLAECVRWFGERPDARLRFVTKFGAVDGLVGLPHRGHTRARASVNADPVARGFEAGVDPVDARLAGLSKLAADGYPVGVVVAPIMPIDGWRDHYADLLDRVRHHVGDADGLTFELITHRFTAGSKGVLLDWYPKTKLDLDEAGRDAKRNKFGGTKYVYPKAAMAAMREWFTGEIARRFPRGRVLYWT